ncbi:LOW QUALITY PROTEIN: hypothetical protein T265_13067 [Opisthorchis viverrini]|uniref:Uncharacterized protein n=1 Tax=Opisthorchis viverrini TaxID=6198 RepID=A0A075A5U6_OPIVI|nr:LOW QUALITY PROTEIN: hypothetical protein T265_13067 [Opisthorchis viverrini]KER31005.1 LOW QUALITY PROTEIN: hypothetical protein T265_13067 [Opisthorchis viverrini]
MIYRRSTLLIRLLKTLRQSVAGFLLLEAHQAQSPSVRQSYAQLEPDLHKVSTIHLFSDTFIRVISQLKASDCATLGRLMFQLSRYLRYRDTCGFVMHYS